MMRRRARVHLGILGVLHALALGVGILAWGGAGDDPCVPDDERARIEAELAENIERLTAEGALAAPLGTAVLLDWPLRPKVGFDDPGYHQIATFVDHDLTFGGRRDYNCGQRTIDQLGNHAGTDIESWPHPWLKMENDDVEVVAAAGGTIVGKQDGFYDKNCSCTGSANFILVRHSDNSVAWYFHLKKQSLTSKTLGSTVVAGEYLGRVGSSGCSSKPHLHFELHLANGALQDPFAGPCNTLNANSWWREQPPYYDSAINKIMTGAAASVLVPCPQPENTNEQSSFTPFPFVYFTTYYRDALAGQVATYRIVRPDGTVKETFDYVVTWSDPQHARIHTRQFSISDPDGEWRLTVDYLGRHYEAAFSIAGSGGGSAHLLSVGKIAGGVSMTWDDSCETTQGLAGIAIGDLGSWYSHSMNACNYNGSGFLPWAKLQGSRYFLIVPRNPYREGSYGLDSAGNERAPGYTICLPQQLGCD